jgi:deoxyxylulose-5-phosphate synthase
MLFTALNHNGPIAIRYPRGAGIGVPLDADFKSIPIGESELLREGRDTVIFALGSMVYPSMEAAEILGAEVFQQASLTVAASNQWTEGSLNGLRHREQGLDRGRKYPPGGVWKRNP